MSSLFRHLAAAHRMLTREIGRERARVRPDPARLARLKKERLAVKDGLYRHLPDTARTLRAILARLRRALA